MLCEMQIRALGFEETVCVPGSVLVLGGSWRRLAPCEKMQQIDAETCAKSLKTGLEAAKSIKHGRQIHAKSIKDRRGDALGDLGCPLDMQVGGGPKK